MGFGYGQTTSHYESAAYNYCGERVKMVMNSDMVAHVWNSQTQDFGRISNGNFYFRGRQIFSYGSHYLVGMIMPDGIALLNSEHNSVTTSGHKSDAAAACRNRTRFYVDDLTSLDSWLSSVASALEALRNPGNSKADKADIKTRLRKRAIQELTSNADKLLATGLAPNQGERWSPEVETGVQAGEHLAKLCGLTAQSWQKAKRTRQAAIDKAAKLKAAKEKQAAISDAIEKASTSDSTFKGECRYWLRNYGESYIKQTAIEYFRARKVGKAAGFSAKRLAILFAREKHLRKLAAGIETAKAIAKNRADLLRDIGWLRALPKQVAESFTDKPMSGSGLNKVVQLFLRLSNCQALPPATRADLAAKGEQLALGLPYLNRRDYLLAERETKRNYRTRLRELAARDARAVELRKQWLAGESVMAGTFDAPSGGPALRVYGNELQTSWGASVPLEHAIKAFRFVKLCKESGRTFARNGKTIRVGHFQVDRIDSTGDFVAGCHSFKWSEVARVAKAAGVFDLSADDSAIQESAQ